MALIYMVTEDECRANPVTESTHGRPPSELNEKSQFVPSAVTEEKRHVVQYNGPLS